jgi:hypothetical protein
VKTIVTDAFEIRPGMTGIEHAPGVVVCFDAKGFETEVPTAGAMIGLRKLNGETIDVAISEVKWFETTCTLYLEGLGLSDAPVGSELTWTAKKRPYRVSRSIAQRK